MLFPITQAIQQTFRTFGTPFSTCIRKMNGGSIFSCQSQHAVVHDHDGAIWASQRTSGDDTRAISSLATKALLSFETAFGILAEMLQNGQ